MGNCASTPRNHSKHGHRPRPLPGPYPKLNPENTLRSPLLPRAPSEKAVAKVAPARSEPSEPTSSQPTTDDSPQHESESSALQTKWNWAKGQLLGKGAYGTVYLGINIDSGCLMAVKQVEAPTVADVLAQRKIQASVKELEEEVRTLRQLNHPNIVRYLGTERTDKHVNIFLEWVPGGSIHKILTDFGPFPEKVVRLFTKDVLEGLHYLHKKRIMHRDIKGQNVLLNGDGTIKLADFGASKQVHNIVEGGSVVSHQMHKSMKGTPYFMAPEVISQTGHGRSADIWSLGCLVYEMCTGRPPWLSELDKDHTQLVALYHIVKQGVPKMPDNASAECRDFLRQCWEINPKRRATCEALLKHPFICKAPSDELRASLMGSISLQSRPYVGDMPSPIQEGADEPEASPVARQRPSTLVIPPSPPSKSSPAVQRVGPKFTRSPAEHASPGHAASHAKTSPAHASTVSPSRAPAAPPQDHSPLRENAPPPLNPGSPWSGVPRPRTAQQGPRQPEIVAAPPRPFTAGGAPGVVPPGFKPIEAALGPSKAPETVPERAEVYLPSLANPMNSFAGDLAASVNVDPAGSPYTPALNPCYEQHADDSPEVRLSRHVQQQMLAAEDAVRRSQMASPFVYQQPALVQPLVVPHTNLAGAPLSPISENSMRVSANQRADTESSSLDGLAKYGVPDDSGESRENARSRPQSRLTPQKISSFVEFNNMLASVDEDPADADIRKTVERLLAAERPKFQRSRA